MWELPSKLTIIESQRHLFISIYMLINVLEDPPVGVIEVEVKIPEYDT